MKKEFTKNLPTLHFWEIPKKSNIGVHIYKQENRDYRGIEI